MQWYCRQLLVFGNAVARVDTDARGAPNGLTPVRWDSLFPRVLSGPRLAFDVANRSAEAQLLGLPPRLFADECLFCRLQSDDGVVGRSPIARAAAAVREGITLSDTAAATFRNGARPSGVLTFPTFLSDIQRTRYADTFIDKISGEMNAGRVPVLEGGMKLEAASMTFLDAQFLEMRGLNTETVCNLFNVPSILIRTGQHAVADLSVYTTAFYQQAVVPLIAIIEAEFDHSIFDDSGLHLAIDADGAMRGSFSSMVAAMAALQQSGSITANEVRAELDWPPIEGGDALAAGNAPNWPADGAGMPSLSPKPGPTGDAPPKPGNHGNEGAKANGKATIQ
jgi:HK97 family phage portal protein